MKQSARQMLASPAFKRMVRRRRALSSVLIIALFAIYYGYIVLVAVNRPLMAQTIGEVTPLGIPFAVAVIVLSWLLTAVYVVWANRVHDPEVRVLKSKIQ
jgi:uncharacterized membrane protein (DUF485 family)